MYIIKKAFVSSPRMRINRKTIKYNLGGLISLLSIMSGKKITAVEILDLFDAIARDKGMERFDSDLRESSDYEKSIQRARKFWQIILPVDEK